MALSERIRQLEDRESELLRELGDLREQNELLEFRVLELAECPDRPTIISDQVNYNVYCITLLLFPLLTVYVNSGMKNTTPAPAQMTNTW